jgi:hypothetical protein
MLGAICELGRVVAVYFNVCAILFLQGGALTVPLSKSNPQKTSDSELKASDIRPGSPELGGAAESPSPCVAGRVGGRLSADSAVDHPADLPSAKESKVVGERGERGEGDDSSRDDSKSTSTSQIVFLWDRVVKPSDSGSTVPPAETVANTEIQYAMQHIPQASRNPERDFESILYWMDVSILPPPHGPPQISQS